MSKVYSAKVGTQPWLITMKGRTKPSVGKRIEFKRVDNKYETQTGIIDKITEDGVLFIYLI